MNLNVGRGGAMKRPSMPLTQTPPAKRSVTADRFVKQYHNTSVKYYYVSL